MSREEASRISFEAPKEEMEKIMNDDWIVVSQNGGRCSLKKQNGRVFARIWEYNKHTVWVIYVGGGDNVANRGLSSNLEQAKEEASAALSKIAGFNK